MCLGAAARVDGTAALPLLLLCITAATTVYYMLHATAVAATAMRNAIVLLSVIVM